MKKHLMIKMIALSAVILLVLIGAGSAKAEKPYKSVTYYVNDDATGENDGTSWQDAFTDLQSALDAALSGDEIWVAAGTYKPHESDRSVSFSLVSGVKIYGGFEGDEMHLKDRRLDPSLTVLSGDIGTSGDTDNSYHVVYANGVTDAVLDCFKVTGGRGDSGGSGGEFAGAGMYNNNSSLTVANCTFMDNRVAVTSTWAVGLGAGMYNYNSAPVVTNCTFIANKAGNVYIYTAGRGGGMYNEGYFVTDENDWRWPLVTGCTFSDNVASSMWSPNDPQFGGGGGMYNFDCSPTVDSCIFERNLGGSGGGMLNYYAKPTITNCIFNTNSNTYRDGMGGAIYNLADATILNCTFYQNGWQLMTSGTELFRPNTKEGGAVYDLLAGSTIFNCIFSNNAVLGSGGAVACATTHVNRGTFLTNCLFYENNSWQGYSDPSAEVINHIVGKFHPDSIDNLYDIDPLLVDPAGGDFHLPYDSPCVDAGYYLKHGNYLWPPGLPATDFEGDKRIIDGDDCGGPGIDIGADEYTPE